MGATEYLVSAIVKPMHSSLHSDLPTTTWTGLSNRTNCTLYLLESYFKANIFTRVLACTKISSSRWLTDVNADGVPDAWEFKFAFPLTAGMIVFEEVFTYDQFPPLYLSPLPRPRHCPSPGLWLGPPGNLPSKKENGMVRIKENPPEQGHSGPAFLFL